MKRKWVFTVRYCDDGSIKTIKARFVACGYSQTTDDYDTIFAATLPGCSMRFLFACIADEDLETDHVDAVKAFTQAKLTASYTSRCLKASLLPVTSSSFTWRWKASAKVQLCGLAITRRLLSSADVHHG